MSIKKRIKTDDAINFLQTAGWVTKAWMRSSGWRMTPAKQQVAVRMWMYMPDNRKRDADNLIKLTFDALKGVAFVDDSDALPQVMAKSVDKQNPRLEVELEVMEASV